MTAVAAGFPPQLSIDPWAHAGGPPDPSTPPPGRPREGGRWVRSCCGHRDRAVEAAGGPTELEISTAHTVPGSAVYTEWSTREGVPVAADRVGQCCTHAV